MSGAVISRPEIRHSCAPGWTDGGESDMFPGSRYAIPPTAWEYPKGTVWQCDCGRAWVSQGPPAANAPGFTSFRPERWLERRRRLRSAP